MGILIKYIRIIDNILCSYDMIQLMFFCNLRVRNYLSCGTHLNLPFLLLEDRALS
jgi:hypothetical protein